jgi:hypothetical protein
VLPDSRQLFVLIPASEMPRTTEECYRVTRVLQECYKSVTRALQGRYQSVTIVLFFACVAFAGGGLPSFDTHTIT